MNILLKSFQKVIWVVNKDLKYLNMIVKDER